jgi:Ca2+-binding EF-hand superfamily protein
MTESQKLTASQHEEMIKQKVKDAFKQWDANNDGIISKVEMKTVLLKLLNKSRNGAESVSEQDVEDFMSDADKNANGVIEYDEFLDWILRPGAKMTTGASGSIQTFDLEACLKPLYEVYDKNGDGQVTWSEFEECFCILANSMQLSHPKKGKSTTVETIDVEKTREVFRTADKNKDKWVSFEEFCDWQRDALANSGLHSADLNELIPALARQLRRVYQLSDGNADETDPSKLEKMINDIADFTRDLWNKDKAAQSKLHMLSSFPNRWTDPPVGLNVNRMKGYHMKQVPGMMIGVEKLDLEATVIPAAPANSDEMPAREDRVWLAKLVQIVTLRNKKAQREDPVYYMYKHADMSWVAMDSESVFNSSMEALSPELRVFCQLKTEANFGLEINWQQIQQAMDMSVSCGWLKQEQRDTYTGYMTNAANQMVKSEREEAMVDKKTPVTREELNAILDKTVKLAPRHVMATLSGLGIFEVSELWADFME